MLNINHKIAKASTLPKLQMCITILLQSFHLHLVFYVLSLATGKWVVHEIKRQFKFMYCDGHTILYSVQLICKFAQYHQIKLNGYFNIIIAGEREAGS